MKKIPLLFLIFLPYFFNAQITLDASDVPQAGDVLTTVNCDVPANFSIGAAGANQTYDLSSMIPTDTSSINFVAPSGTAGAAEFPNATLAGEAEGSFVYYQQTSSELFLLGIYADTSSDNSGQYLASQYSPPSKVFEIPTTYNTTFTSMSSISFTQEDLSGFGDSIRVTNAFDDEILFDGYGTVITPNGTFDGLRERNISTSTSTIEILNFGIWTTINTVTNTDTSYNWYSNNNIGLASASIFNGQVSNASYSLQGNVMIAPNASFSANDQGGGIVDFTDNSTNDPTSWDWDFGDGNSSTMQNPQHTYSNPGTYNVCLTVANNAGSDVTCMDVNVSIIFAPDAAFSFTGEDSGTVDFTDNSTNNPTSWDWDFGDGNSSTMQNPQHTYSTPGTYNVCLTASNGVGSGMICMDVSVTVAPVASFTFMAQNSGVVDFMDESSNDPITWLWDFGDGNTSTDQNPQHTYTTSGMYTVCLTVTNSAGSNTICETVNVVISSIDDPDKIVNVEVFPNPVDHTLNMRLENNRNESLRFNLMDGLGRTVRELNIVTNGTFDINIENLGAGIYYFTFIDKDGYIRNRGSIMKN